MYYVQRYRPAYEAISKEVQLLARHFATDNSVRIHDLHLDGILKMKWNQKIISYHFLLYPLMVIYTKYLSSKNDINHIYTSLGDLPYLNVINKNQTILTAAASCSIDKVKRRLPLLKKLKTIVVETEFHKKQLEQHGIQPEKIKLIYPPVDVSAFSYKAASGNFKILYASCPTRKEDFEKRGINLILNFANRRKSVEITLAWRGGALRDIKALLQRKNWRNITLNNSIVQDMNEEYAQVHATIIPYTQFDDFLKLIPNSALESLAAGKPLIVSTKTELAQMVQKYKCGVVFEPNALSLHQAVSKLEKNYFYYQRHCRELAEKLFSKDHFLQQYAQIYRQILQK